MRLSRHLLLTSLIIQTACGFSPVYGDHAHNAPVADEMNQVAIDNIPDRPGQMLRNDLIDRMYGKGRPHTTRYTLSVTLHISTQDVGIQENATSTRSLVDTSAGYTLKDKDGKEIISGTAHSISNFNKLDNQYGSEVANQSATQRTVNEIAEQIVNRISLYFAERAETNSAHIVSKPNDKNKTSQPSEDDRDGFKPTQP